MTTRKTEDADLAAPTQAEADRLLALPKRYEGQDPVNFPGIGDGELSLALASSERGCSFQLRCGHDRIHFDAYKAHLSSRKTIGLMRLEVASPRPHANPDGEILHGSHLHYYREGFNLRWARPLPPELAEVEDKPDQLLDRFMDLCHITRKPVFQFGL